MGRLAGSTCYLIGPIDHDEGCVEWRRRVTGRLREFGVRAIDPTLKPFRKLLGPQRFDEIGEEKDTVVRLKRERRFEELALYARRIVQLDLRCADQSTFAIFNYKPGIQTCGSYDEALTVYRGKRPILVVCEEGVENIPLWLWGNIDHHWFFDTWDGMFEYLSAVDDEANPIPPPKQHRWILFDVLEE